MAMDKLPVPFAAPEDERDAQRPFLVRQAANLSVLVLDRHQHRDIAGLLAGRIGLHEFDIGLMLALALALVAESDLLAALPRSLLARHAARHGIECVEPPLSLPAFRICAIATRAALTDAGVAWLYEALGGLLPD